MNMFGGVDAKAVNSHFLHHPLQVSHEITGCVLLDRITAGNAVGIEGIDCDVGFPGRRVEKHYGV